MESWDPEVRELLSRLMAGQEDVLGEDLLGSYVFGSVATGDFEPDVSDVDTATVLRADPTSDQLTALGRLHDELVEDVPGWEERVEVGEYVDAVRQHLLTWRDSLDDLVSRGDQAYAILTMCRGLRTLRTGGDVSKREAARWASEEFPEHAYLISDALEWRARSRGGLRIDGTATREATARFVQMVLDQLDRPSSGRQGSAC